MTIRFEDICIDSERYELLRGGERVPVEPLIFDLVTLLATHPDRLFSKDELMARLWEGKIVSDSTIASAIKSARKALGDNGERQRFIETVRGRGVRFVAQPESTAANSTPSGESKSSPFDNHSLIVMPLQNLIEVSTLRGQVTAIAPEIERVLKRVPLLEISMESARYSQSVAAPTPRQLYEDLGVDYLVSGSARVERNSLHVSLQLVDTQSGFIRWSEQFTFA
ncbi:MAG: winged helix-turn-helix domain-containing protein, partial [Pseudomonadota bacterium]